MITSVIQKKVSDLTPVERKIASFVLKEPKKVIRMTVHQVAESCGVAPSAITRFCKSVKVAGFAELKIVLAQELGAVKNDSLPPAFEQGDGTKVVVRKVFCSEIQTLRDTVELLDLDAVEGIVSALSNAKRIFVFGVGTSSVIAMDAQYRFSQLGLWATACTDILMMNVTAVNLSAGDAVLAISHSGRTKAVVDAVRHAKKVGATTLAITSFTDSLLYQESDVAVSVYADEIHYPVEAVSARVAHICLIDALTMALAAKNFDSFAEHIKARNMILDEIRYEKTGEGVLREEQSDSDLY